MPLSPSIPSQLDQYQTLLRSLQGCSESDQVATLAWLGRNDLYFLLRYLMNRPDIEHPWLFKRCREIQANPNDHLDLWAREHYKSTIITFGLTVQDILNNPDETFGIFSHVRPIAKGFLRQIKREFEANERLKQVYPDVLWSDPDKEAPKWSEDDGLIVRRQSNPKESTVEAHGLVDGQPISRHFGVLIYDDVVTPASVSTPEMIAKTTDALALSFNLGKVGGKRRFIGTRYHFNDSYRTIIDRGTASPRIHRATGNGEVDGEPVLMTRELLAQKRRDMGPYIFGAQMMQDPAADRTQGFKREWLKHYQTSPAHTAAGCNLYILVDAANEKRATSDYTAMWVIGLGQDGNFYVVDMLRDRLNLTQRADALFRLHKKWKPIEVRYEKYGMMADIAHVQDRQGRENYRFNIVEVAGITPKPDRIKRLVPTFETGKWYFPVTHHYTDYEGIPRDLVHVFIEEEYAAFPVALHDDMLDSLARIAEPDLPLIWPQQDEPEEKRERYGKVIRSHSAWAA